MKLDVDYQYSIWYIPYRHQNKSHFFNMASTSIDIREVSGEDARLVAKVGLDPADVARYDYGVHDKKRFQQKADGTSREIRYFEGKFFVEIGPVEDLVSTFSDRPSETHFGRVDNRYLKVTEEDRKKHSTIEEVMRRSHNPLRSYGDDKGAHVANKLQEVADKTIIVDGIVFEFTPQPILWAGDVYGEQVFTIASRPKADLVTESYDDLHYWPNSARERLDTASLNELAVLEGKYPEYPVPVFAVVDPSVFVYDGDTKDVLVNAEHLEELMSREVQKLPWEALNAYFSLRDALKDAGSRITTNLVSALEQVASLTSPEDQAELEAIADYQRVEHDRWRWNTEFEETNSRERYAFSQTDNVADYALSAASTIDRWGMRPMENHWDSDIGPVSSIKQGSASIFEVTSKGLAGDCMDLIGGDIEEVLEAVADGKRIIASIHDHSAYGQIYAVDGYKDPQLIASFGEDTAERRKLVDDFLALSEAAYQREQEFKNTQLFMGGM